MNKGVIVCVCVSGEPEGAVFDCLESLKGQKNGAQKFSVLGVLNRSFNQKDKARLERIKALFAERGFMVVEGSYPAILDSRLAAIRFSLKRRAEIVAFTDPDCVPERGWVKKISGRLGKLDASFWAVGGADPFRKFPGKANSFARLDWKSRLGTCGETYWLDTNNIALRADKLGKRFDFLVTLSGGGTDSEISNAIVSLRGRLFFDPEIVVVHSKNYTVGSLLSEGVKYGIEHANAALSGSIFTRSKKTHPGIFLLSQPIVAFFSVVAALLGNFAIASSISLFAAIFGGVFLCKGEGRIPNPSSVAIFWLRTYSWMSGGLIGFATFPLKKCRQIFNLKIRQAHAK